MSDAAEIINTIREADGSYRAVNVEHERLARGLVPKLLRVVGRVPFADDLAAAYYAARDPQTPKKAKTILMAALAYFVLPIDAVPDVVIGLGFTDDATVLATALGVVGMHVKERHRQLARRLLGLAEPVKETA